MNKLDNIFADEGRIARTQGDKGLCLQCGKIFSTLGSARRHFNMTHVTRASGTVPPPCPICGKQFRHIETLKDHLRKLHQVYQAQYSKILQQ
jgi:uncharacterized C2H2 Zn-finger protein